MDPQRKGKKPKKFLALEEALALATTIADNQESKSMTKAANDKKHLPTEKPRRSKVSRLKQKKAVIVAEKSAKIKEKRAKRNRKQESNHDAEVAPKKRVAFA